MVPCRHIPRNSRDLLSTTIGLGKFEGAIPAGLEFPQMVLKSNGWVSPKCPKNPFRLRNYRTICPICPDSLSRQPAASFQVVHVLAPKKMLTRNSVYSHELVNPTRTNVTWVMEKHKGYFVLYRGFYYPLVKIRFLRIPYTPTMISWKVT